jgi:hypothetical protein
VFAACVFGTGGVDCPDALDLVGAAAGQIGGSAAVSPEARSATMLWGEAGVGYPTGVFAGATAWGAASECPLIPLGVNIRQTIDPNIGRHSQCRHWSGLPIRGLEGSSRPLSWSGAIGAELYADRRGFALAEEPIVDFYTYLGWGPL